MTKDSYYIQGQNGEYITLKKDVDDEYSYLISLKYEDAEIMDLEFAKSLLADLNEVEGEEYFRIYKVGAKNKSHYILLGCPALDNSNCVCQNCRHPKIEPGTEICSNIEDCITKKIYKELTQGTISTKDIAILDILGPMVELD